MKTCAVIPAAGRGSRLGLDLPKLLVPLTERETIWSVLKRNLRPHVDHIHVVLSPAGASSFGQALEGDPDASMISTSIQPAPTGMGDAIFRGEPTWSSYRNVIVVWGDQVHVSENTIASSLALQADAERRVMIPLVALREPYVEYRFDAAGRLDKILQTREGDVCQPGGLGDVGTFVLSTGGLAKDWQTFLAQVERGALTGEVNFLPFLAFLSRTGWDVRSLPVADPREARGINTPDDLVFFREVYREAD